MTGTMPDFVNQMRDAWYKGQDLATKASFDYSVVKTRRQQIEIGLPAIATGSEDFAIKMARRVATNMAIGDREGSVPYDAAIKALEECYPGAPIRETLNQLLPAKVMALA